jgi:cyclic pyranopterin phosphate synthase
VSVTDRCNLRCIYCMPPEGVERIPHNEILTFEEIERVVGAAVSAGVDKVRLTGGEPLVRRNIVGLVSILSNVPGVGDLPMTTNGTLLDRFADDLKKAGLSRITVSMDTLRPERFERITKKPWLGRVMAGIEAANRAGLGPLKINVVAVPGMNDDEVVDFAKLARERGLEVRFIERMPFLNTEKRPHCGKASREYIPSAKLREVIEAELGALVPDPANEQGRPARVYAIPGGRGRLGFIAPISEPFCKQCQRMRLTPDGKLRVCLASDTEVDVKGPLRSGASDDDLLDLFKKAVEMKPLQDVACFAPGKRVMSQIGG